MAKDFGQGIFTMPFITKIAGLTDLETAKHYALQEIEDSPANFDNKTKAVKLVQSAKNIRAFVIAMSNFSLSHQGLKTI